MAVRKKYDRSVLGRGLDDIGNGRGLDALIDTSEVKTQGSSNLNEIPIEQIEPNPDQPRREFDETAMQELASSIATMGIIAPITLRQVAPDRYQIIAGERRWRASQQAGLTTIPAYIRTANDESVMELALVENIQREDLNAIEIALAYEHLAETSGMTQERISERVGKSRTAVTNYMRLLKLPAQIQMALKNREIDMGHARALLSLDSPSMQLKLFKEVLKNQYSVRKVEEMVQMLKNGEDVQGANRKIAAKAKLPAEYDAVKKRLTTFFQTKIQMTCSPTGKGKICIPFDNERDLERILKVLNAGH
ncbi:ParB/RepB/Spo0J family partition protein [Prevotella sp. E13-17]|uniref:ParB/RepB/Spo0J family partition protein n=1 Tax=Prevotella sp. E13-17 TaxID=2913616 RepID=UPI001EDBB603|nr:ParB/RepB/Spo0J family partition protein [Prevotella sp. E13-17]UKK51764.1 ParB/RepB/Spo0J family partition protein [Prevotella sp. E13-17]